MKKQGIVAIIIAVLAIGSQANAAINHLLLTEVGYDTNQEGEVLSSEYIEILNPTDTPISLNNYYLTDSNLYTSITTAPLINTGSKDNILKFPPGYTLSPGQLAVVTQNGNAFLAEFFDADLTNYTGQVIAPLLFETIDSTPAVADMTSLNSGGANENQRRNLRLANTDPGNLGEFVMLFYWDGTTPRVKDVDLVGWGYAVDPEGYKLKGPLVKGSDGSPYLVDNGPRYLTAMSATKPFIKRRFSESFGSETLSGGNGITNHDESTELLDNTWNDYDFAQRSPGTVEIPLGDGHQPPEFSLGQRSPKYPTSAASITLSGLVLDAGGSISNVKIYINTSGSTFIPLNATNSGGNSYQVTVGPYLDDTVVRWYMEATDNTGHVARSPAGAPYDFNAFVVDNTTLGASSLTINEVLYDNVGTDAYEFVEIYNNDGAPARLPYFRFNTNANNDFRLPGNAEIPGFGYMILTSDPAALAAHYTIPPGTQVIDWGYNNLANTDRLTLRHVNEVPFGTFLQDVTYLPSSPWPVTNVSITDQSIELKAHGLDNTQGANWAASTGIGTPGKGNSMTSTIPDWNLY